ncbi:MAG: PEGA domain-containing protein [Patescibacteria group bacterium]|jgi:hypothetical protein
MNTVKRKILFVIFIIAFFIISPIVIFYASGYKLDWKNPLSFYFIQKTGMLIIASDPAEAEIFLNEKKQKNFSPDLKIFKGGETIKTPAKIKNLLPGSYDLRVERPGYWPWERRIKIFSEQITHVLDVRLFRHSLPTLSILTNDTEIKVSPNDKKMILLPSGDIFEIKNEAVSKTSSSSQASATWSPDSGKIIFPEEIANLKSPEKNISLKKILGEDFSLAKWGKSNEEIIYLHNNKLSRLNLATQAAQVLLIEEKILDFLPGKNQIAALSTAGTAVKLKIFSPDKETAGKEISLPFSENYLFINEEGKFLNILDKSHSLLYLIDPATGQIKETLKNCKYAAWFNDDTLFYANDFEIWALNLTQNTKRLLTRVSENPITSILATKTDNYLLYFTNKTINILTWDKGEEKIQPTELLRLEKISSPIFAADSGIIYFLSQIDNQQGLYKLAIR